MNRTYSIQRCAMLLDRKLTGFGKLRRSKLGGEECAILAEFVARRFISSAMKGGGLLNPSGDYVIARHQVIPDAWLM